jgi:hypothetical protein
MDVETKLIFRKMFLLFSLSFIDKTFIVFVCIYYYFYNRTFEVTTEDFLMLFIT